MFEEIKNLKFGRKDLRNFGIVIGSFLLILSGFLLFKEKEAYKTLFYLAVIFPGLGIIAPLVLKPIYTIWMVFAIILGWFMTRVILTILFYIVISPIGIVARLFGKDFLSIKRNNDQPSYWNMRKSSIEKNQNYENCVKMSLIVKLQLDSLIWSVFMDLIIARHIV